MPRFYFKKKIKCKYKILIIIFLILITGSIILKYINNKVMPILMEYASIESVKLTSIILNNATKDNIENIDINNLFIITKEENNIKTIDFNSVEVNKLLTSITTYIQKSFNYIENGDINLLNIPLLYNYNKDKLKKGIIYEIPIGVILNNSFLSNIGPKIPVRLNLYGEVISKVNTKITNYGINNALIEIFVDINIDTKVILPFTYKIKNVDVSIPIAIKLIEGNVPNYYGSDKSLSIPFE